MLTMRTPFLFALCVLVFTTGSIAAPRIHADGLGEMDDGANVALGIVYDEVGLLAALNAQRATVDLPTLTIDSTLTDVARARSLDMASLHAFSHASSDGQVIFDLLDAAGVDWQLAGENLAESRYVDAIQAAIDGFMMSPQHRDNVLNPGYAHVGIGAAMGSDRMTFLAVVFTD